MDKWDVRRILRNDLRDAALFIGGMLGIAHETLLVDHPDNILIILFAAMIGLTAFLQLPGSVIRNGKKEEKNNASKKD